VIPVVPGPVEVEIGHEVVVNVTKDFAYLPTGFPMGLPSGQMDLPPFSKTPPPNLKRAPAASGEVLYVTLPLGNVAEEMISVAMVDRKRLYFDDNGNGDLTDDAAHSPGLSCNRNLTLAVRTGDGSIERRPYAIWFWYIESQGAPRFYSKCHYTGRIRIGSGTYRAVAFEMQGHNGLLRDDGLWVDLDSNGKLSDEEHFSDGQLITVVGQEYRLALQAP